MTTDPEEVKSELTFPDKVPSKNRPQNLPTNEGEVQKVPSKTNSQISLTNVQSRTSQTLVTSEPWKTTSQNVMINGPWKTKSSMNAPLRTKSQIPISVQIGQHSKKWSSDQQDAVEPVWTTSPEVAVKIRMGSDLETNGIPAESIPTWFNRIVDAYASSPAMKVKRNGVWRTWTYKQYQDDVTTAAKAFIHLGLEPFHAVGIMGFNAPEWFISDIGTMYAGGLAVGIYTTNSADACLYNATNSQANIIVVEDDKQLQKILQIRNRLPLLKAIVQYIGKPSQKYEKVYSWEEFMTFGDTVPDSVLAARQKLIAPNKCCTVIYTSGTTGNPKGAMLTHDNLIWTSKMALKFTKLKFGCEVCVSYLPLSHVAAQMTDIYLPISTGSVVCFAQPDALKGTLVDALKEIRPTVLLGVPRVFEKMEERMRAAALKNGRLKKAIAKWARDVGFRGNIDKMNGKTSLPICWSVASVLVFKKVRQALGLDRSWFVCSGAAPMRRETQEFFLSLNILVFDIYGMSESSAPHTINAFGSFKLGSAGKELPGVRTKIADADAAGNGEVCIYGRHVFMGYLGLDEKTRETFDDEGYLRTGDIGNMDADGFLFITGRLKELLITAGGEKVAPVAIEDLVKEQLPIISHCMLIGEKRKFLSMIMSLKTEVDLETGAPHNKLTEHCQEWIKEHCGTIISTVEEAQVSEPVKNAIQVGLDKVNQNVTSHAQVVHKFAILPVDFSILGGEVGPTLKVKRPFVAKKYAELIESFYPSTDAYFYH